MFHPIFGTNFSPFCRFITPALFHTKLKTYLFRKSLPPQFVCFCTHRTDFTVSGLALIGFYFCSFSSLIFLATCGRRGYSSVFLA